MSRILKYILAANLLVLAILAFVYPHLMVGPGKLIVGHQKLEADCFACHAAWRGASTPSPRSRRLSASVFRLWWPPTTASTPRSTWPPATSSSAAPST